MTDQELKRLSRAELLEMLVEQSALCDSLRKQLDEAKAALADRKIVLERAGTMAEAALRLSGVFEAVDRAAALYLENIQRMNQEIEDVQAEHHAVAEEEADEAEEDKG